MKSIFKKITKKVLIGIVSIIVIAAPIIYLLLINASKTEAAWYDDNWAYRQAVTVTVTSSASDITNLQTLLTVDTATAITASKLQSSCQDLRFTSQSGKNLPYYIDSGCNGASTKIWVLADLVPKNTTTYTMYMYYGNPSAPAGTDSAKFTLYNGLVGYWPMNESSWNGTSGEVKDYSVNGNNGTSACAGGGCTVPSTATGKYSNGGNFDGSEDYVTVSNSSVLNLTSAITVSFWMNFDSTNTNFMMPMAKDGNGYWTFQINNGSGSTRSLRWIVSGQNVFDNTVTADTWQHIVVTQNGTTANFYVNGVLTGSNSSAPSIPSNPVDLTIGRRPTDCCYYFKGKLDDARIYNRALSASEVSQLYSATDTIMTTGTGISLPSTSFATEEKAPGPVAYWKFDEGTGTNAQDSTQQNNDGTISGATWQTEDQCIAGKCLSFDGSNDVVTVSNTVSGIQTVSLWIKPITTSEQIIDINGTASISVSSGTISATNFTSPTIYVNGVVSSILVANTWQYVTVTTGTALSGSAIKIGQISTNYGQAFIDDVKLYTSARTAAQILTDYNSRGSVKGVSTALGGNNETMKQLSNGLVGYWKMDEASAGSSRTDSSGNVNTLTDSNSVGVAVGKFGNAGQFTSASSQSVSITDNATLSMASTDFAFSVWVYADTLPGAVNYPGILGKYGSGTTREYLLYYNGDDSRFHFGVCNDGTNCTSVTANTLGAPSTATWYHIIAWYDNTAKTVNIQINNGGVDSASHTTGVIDSTSNFVIGRPDPNAATGFWNGRIDEVRAYKKLLTSADRTALYNFAPGPVGYWNFDENTGTSANDTSGNGYTGTLTAGPTWKPGKYGSSVKFDGSDDYVSLTGTTGASFDPNGSYSTLAFWMKDGATTNRFIMSKDGANSQGWNINYGVGGGVQSLTFGHKNSSNGTAYGRSTNDFSLGWHHVAIVFRSDSSATTNNDVNIYIDGILNQGSLTNSTAAALDSSTKIKLGARGSDALPSGYFDGQLDEVKFYNYARTAKQIVEDMNAGHPAVGSPVGSAIGHWKFDEGYDTTANNSGNGGSTLNGTLTSMASPATSTSGWTQSGKFGKGLVFDGSNDFIQITNNTALQLSSNITVSAWVKTSNSDSTADVILAKWSSAGNRNYWLGKLNATTLAFYVNDTENVTTNLSLINDNSWHHVVGIADTNNSLLRIFVDGVQKNTAVYSGISETGTSVLDIGTNPDVTNQVWNGSIDDVKVYNYALTADEVKLDMNRGSSQVMGALSDTNAVNTSQPQAAGSEYCVPGDTTSTSCAAPVGRWDFEEGAGSTVNDKSGNANTGTWQGTLGSQWKSGKVGGGGNFNGSDNVVNVADATSLRPTSVTIESWFKSTATSLGTILEKSRGAGLGSSYTVYLGPSGFTGAVAGSISFAGYNGSSWISLVSNNTYNDGNWHHLAITYDATTAYIYVDGKLDKSGSLSRALDYSTNSYLLVGATLLQSTPTYQSLFNGQIDQVRVFNYARTAAQVAWDYNRGAPVGHWKFDECQGSVANDSSGNGNSGTITPGAGGQTAVGTCTGSAGTLWKDGATGKYNSSLDFDNTDDYVTMGDASTLEGIPTLTLSAWVKRASTSTQDVIVGKEDFNVSGERSYQLRIESSGAGGAANTIRFDVFNTTNSGTSINTTQTITDTNWHHIVGTYDGTTMKVYKDGILDPTTGSLTGTIDSGTDPFTIGINGDLTSSPFSGQIDDVKIYNYALTATQVKGLYNGGAVRFGPTTGSP